MKRTERIYTFTLRSKGLSTRTLSLSFNAHGFNKVGEVWPSPYGWTGYDFIGQRFVTSTTLRACRKLLEAQVTNSLWEALGSLQDYSRLLKEESE